MGTNVKQSELAALFGRSVPWVCKKQTREVDPMPRDLAGATEWGRRNACLPGTSEPKAAIVPGGLSEKFSGLELADVRLKELRAQKIQRDIARVDGEVFDRAEVEEREVRAAAEFRVAAIEYPARARTVIERFVTDPAAVEKIMEGLQPLAAELLNRSDPTKVLQGRSIEEVRQVLNTHVDWLISILSRASAPPLHSRQGATMIPKITLLARPVQRALRGERNLPCMLAEMFKLNEEHAEVCRKLRAVDRQRCEMEEIAENREVLSNIVQRRLKLEMDLARVDRDRLELVNDIRRIEKPERRGRRRSR